MSPELALMLLADARLPVAGHTQSAGLEPAIMGGLTDVPAYIQARLATVTRTEAATAVVARSYLLAARPLVEVTQAWAARTPSAPLRTASRMQGAALLRLLGRLLGERLPVTDLIDAPRGCVLGAAAVAYGLAGDSVARLIAYDEVASITAAALKLTPMDPAVATQWVVAAMPGIEALVADVAGLDEADDIPAYSAPQIEEWTYIHSRTTRRLFRA